MNPSSFHPSNNDASNNNNSNNGQADMRSDVKKAGLTLDFNGNSGRKPFYFNGPPTATPFLDSTDINKFGMNTPDVEHFLNQAMMNNMDQSNGQMVEMRVKSEQETRVSPLDDVQQDMKALNVDPTARIDMNDQEAAKLERKRLRNRIAASKCRKRKLEKIARLEDKVKRIKGENSDLSQAISRLKNHVMSLKEDLIDHVKHGCVISGFSF